MGDRLDSAAGNDKIGGDGGADQGFGGPERDVLSGNQGVDRRMLFAIPDLTEMVTVADLALI